MRHGRGAGFAFRRDAVPSIARLAAPRPGERLIWTLALGALGLAWPTATVAAYLPPVLERFTSSDALIGLILAAEGVFALALPPIVGPLSDSTVTPWGRRRPYLALAVPPLAIALALLGSLPTLGTTVLLLFVVFFGNYVYEPPWRGLYADLVPDAITGRAQGASHVARGLAMAGALVGGGVALAAWRPLPFLIAAIVTAASCGLVPVLVREPPARRRRFRPLRARLAAPLAVFRREPPVRRFLIVNAAWETAFAGMRTFVVLYIVQGLGQPLYVASAVLAVVTAAYLVAAAVLGPFVDRLGLGRVLLWSSLVYGVGLLAATFATQWHDWYYGFVAVVGVAGGTVMTLAWGLLYKLMPSHDQGSISGLAIMTRGIGLLVGPPAVGLAIDLLEPIFESTGGYAAMWPVVAIPVLAVLPHLRRLAASEARVQP